MADIKKKLKVILGLVVAIGIVIMYFPLAVALFIGKLFSGGEDRSG